MDSRALGERRLHKDWQAWLADLCTEEPCVGLSAGPSYICLFCGPWHRAFRGAGSHQLFVGQNKCNTAPLCSPGWTDGSHLHSWTQVAAAASSIQRMWDMWQKSSPAPAHCRRLDTEVNPALCVGLSQPFLSTSQPPIIWAPGSLRQPLLVNSTEAYDGPTMCQILVKYCRHSN